MYGLKKEKQNPFEFDLEKELKEDPSLAKKLLDQADQNINSLNETMRSGTDAKELDSLKTLLKGYKALKIAVSKLTQKK